MCFEKGFMIQCSEWTLTHASMSGAESSVAASLEGLCLPNSVQIQFSSVMAVSSVRKKHSWCLSRRTGPKPPLNGMSECAAITVSFREEPFLFETFPYITCNHSVPCKPSVIWSSDSGRSEKYNVPSCLLFLPSLSLIFQALYTKSSSFQGRSKNLTQCSVCCSQQNLVHNVILVKTKPRNFSCLFT